MPDNKMDTIQSVNLYFGKKDPDLCKWVHSVPRGLFSYLVREGIKAHLNGDENYRLPSFETKKVKKTTITKPLSISADTPEDKQVYDFVTSFDDHMRSFAIKQILRKYLKGASSSSSIGFAKSPKKSTFADPKTEKRASETKEIQKISPETPKKKQNDRIAQLINSTRKRSRA